MQNHSRTTHVDRWFILGSGVKGALSGVAWTVGLGIGYAAMHKGSELLAKKLISG